MQLQLLRLKNFIAFHAISRNNDFKHLSLLEYQWVRVRPQRGNRTLNLIVVLSALPLSYLRSFGVKSLGLGFLSLYELEKSNGFRNQSSLHISQKQVKYSPLDNVWTSNQVESRSEHSYSQTQTRPEVQGFKLSKGRKD